MRVKVTKRQRDAAAKRAAILASPQFREWWEARQTFYPTPRDPYRAFMIDIGLFARVMHKEVWKHRTNRMDYPPVDLPRDIPRRRRRLPPRKVIKRFKKVPKRAEPLPPLTPFEKELVAEAERFVEKFHLPSVRVRFEPEAVGAFYRPALFGEPLIVMPKEYVAKGAKVKGVRQQVVATISHEKGHHAHIVYGTSARAMAAGLEGLAGVMTAKPVGRLKEEKVAWKVAKLYVAGKWTPIMGWRGRYAYGTYLRTFGKIKEH